MLRGRRGDCPAVHVVRDRRPNGLRAERFALAATRRTRPLSMQLLQMPTVTPAVAAPLAHKLLDDGPHAGPLLWRPRRRWPDKLVAAASPSPPSYAASIPLVVLSHVVAGLAVVLGGIELNPPTFVVIWFRGIAVPRDSIVSRLPPSNFFSHDGAHRITDAVNVLFREPHLQFQPLRLLRAIPRVRARPHG